MAAYRRVYDSRHLQADCQEPGDRLPLFSARPEVTLAYLNPRVYDKKVKANLKFLHADCCLYLSNSALAVVHYSPALAQWVAR